MTLTLRFAARSHTGLLRDGNEDSVYAGPRLLAVADGMGGHAAGEVASAVAIAAIAALDEDAPGPDLLDALLTAAMAANTRLHDMVEGDAALEGMGTTLTAILWGGSRLGLLHIGDSRAYLLRDGELSQIAQAQAAVDKAKLELSRTDVHAPMDGIVENADNLQVGQMAVTGVGMVSLVRSTTAWVEASFKERERLFNLPRSSWDDYDRALISKGGGVFARTRNAL